MLSALTSTVATNAPPPVTGRTTSITYGSAARAGADDANATSSASATASSFALRKIAGLTVKAFGAGMQRNRRARGKIGIDRIRHGAALGRNVLVAELERLEALDR